MLISVLFLCIFCLLPACITQVETVDFPVDKEGRYSLVLDEGQTARDDSGSWWLEFEDPTLNGLIEQSLPANLTVKQAEARLRQAVGLQNKRSAALYPPISAEYDFSERKESGSSRDSTSVADLSIAWEIDLWGRLGHKEEAARFLTEAAAEDLRDIGLLISFEIADSYFELIEKKLESRLLQRQIETNRKFLGLTELRFANGAASVVDVYQQRQLLTGRKADIYLVDERVIVLENRLRVLAGELPARKKLHTSDELPSITTLPEMGLPADLLQNRPDLRRLQNGLAAAQYEVAAAVAERLPQIRIGGSTGVIDATFFHRFFLEAFAPLIDWGERKSEVERRRAIVDEQVNIYAQAYLEAVEEVENSIWRERFHLSLLETLKSQLQLANDTLKESRNRYMQGLTDYLPVLAALQTLQNLEIEYLQRRFELVRNRLVLNKALGGKVAVAGADVSGATVDNVNLHGDKR